MEAAASKGVYVCSTIKGLLPALRKVMPSVSFVEIPSAELEKGSKATERWDRDGECLDAFITFPHHRITLIVRV